MFDPSFLLFLLKWTAVIAIILHIRRQAIQIDEGWMQHIIPVIFLWWLVYPLWLFLWPGMYRPGRYGKDPETYIPKLRAKRRISAKSKKRLEINPE